MSEQPPQQPNSPDSSLSSKLVTITPVVETWEVQSRQSHWSTMKPFGLSLNTAIAIGSVSLFMIGWIAQIPWLGIPAGLLTLGFCITILWQPARQLLNYYLTQQQQWLLLATLTGMVTLIGLLSLSGLTGPWFGEVNWEAVGALAEAFGAAGQIMVALLAAYVAWRQYVISRDLTMQQNRITQQQTIDTYFQGISDLILDDQGLLEDWPPERAIAEGRTAAILTGLDADGKAKILRFLSSSKLLTPLKRDRRLGRAIFDGLGGYEEDVEFGVRVIDLGGMLAGADLAGTDLRSTDLSEANLVGATLRNCALNRADLGRTILQGADLTGADLSRARLFYGSAENASPRDRLNPPDYTTGAYTGAAIEHADLTHVKGLSDEQRYYCCAWGGSFTRGTIPGGCEGIPNKLES